MVKAVILLGVAALSVAACARVEVTRVTSDSQEGIRYWRPKPYLLVTPQVDKDKKPVGNLLQIVYLPDTSKEYAIRVVPGIGTAEAKPTLENGWNLTGMDSKVDSKVPETINALATLAEKGGALFGMSIDAADMPPGFYELEFDSNGTLKGLKRVVLLTVKPPSTPTK